MRKSGIPGIPPGSKVNGALCEESIKKADLEPTAIRANLNETRKKLVDASVLLKNSDAQVIAKDIDKIARGLERGLRMGRVLSIDSEPVLEKLLPDLKPHQGTKKCYPYEPFLFAAQNWLCREELVRKRSSLVPGVVTGPPHSGSLSILMSHKGAKIAVGLEEAE